MFYNIERWELNQFLLGEYEYYINISSHLNLQKAGLIYI